MFEGVFWYTCSTRRTRHSRYNSLFSFKTAAVVPHGPFFSLFFFLFSLHRRTHHGHHITRPPPHPPVALPCSQSQNKLNRKLLRHIVRKVLSGVSIILQAVHVRFELPAGGLDGATPAKVSAGVGGGGACDAVGVMLPSLTVSAFWTVYGVSQASRMMLLRLGGFHGR